MSALPLRTRVRAECIGRHGAKPGDFGFAERCEPGTGGGLGRLRGEHSAGLCNRVGVPGTAAPRRSRRRLATVVAAFFVAGVAIGVLLARGDGETALAPARGPAGDPLAWRPGEDATFAARAAAGEGHVIYAKSPGGIVASARRVAHWRPLVEAA